LVESLVAKLLAPIGSRMENANYIDSSGNFLEENSMTVTRIFPTCNVTTRLGAIENDWRKTGLICQHLRDATQKLGVKVGLLVAPFLRRVNVYVELVVQRSWRQNNYAAI